MALMNAIFDMFKKFIYAHMIISRNVSPNKINAQIRIQKKSKRGQT